MNRPVVLLSCCLATLVVTTTTAGEPDPARLAEQVEQTERAFARTMADRDFEAFRGFLSPEAIFFSGETPLRGADEVAARWKPFFEAPAPPFSWEPRTVEVLDTGTLALSSGPVYDPEGECVGSFSSIWRRDANDEWKIVFDKGSADCD
jgi:ketosteroid isomerase-like protein